MKPFVLLLALLVWSLPGFSQPSGASPVNGSPAAQTQKQELLAFIDAFFTEFSALSSKIRRGSDKTAQMDIIHLTRDRFVRATQDSIRASGNVQEIDIISKLWPIGPKSWVVKDIHIAGDVAKASILFYSYNESHKEPIPYALRFIRSNDTWLFLRAMDLRPKKPSDKTSVTLPAEKDLTALGSPQKTLGDYLDYLVANRSLVDIRNPAMLRPAVKKIGDGIKALWADTPAARRARNEATSKLLLQDIAGWQLGENTAAGGAWEGMVEVTTGAKNPMATYIKTKPKVMFKAVQSGNIWLLTDFEIPRAAPANLK